MATTVPPGGPATVTYATDVVNQYTTLGGVTRSHDNNGSVADDGTKLFKYDYRNHLTEALTKSPQATIATYRYDALGRRVEKAVAGGAVTRYLLDGHELVEEVSGTDVWQARYVYEDGIDQPRAMDRADQADVDQDSNTVEVVRLAYHQNAIGTITEVSAPGGQVVEWISYDVYGIATIRNRTGTVIPQSGVGNPLLFTGREFDAETGLYDFRARKYDPVTGRFAQRDPVEYTTSLSTYHYTDASPATFVDPTGLDHAETKVIKVKSKEEAKKELDKVKGQITDTEYSAAIKLINNPNVAGLTVTAYNIFEKACRVRLNNAKKQTYEVVEYQDLVELGLALIIIIEQGDEEKDKAAEKHERGHVEIATRAADKSKLEASGKDAGKDKGKVVDGGGQSKARADQLAADRNKRLENRAKPDLAATKDAGSHRGAILQATRDDREAKNDIYDGITRHGLRGRKVLEKADMESLKRLGIGPEHLRE